MSSFNNVDGRVYVAECAGDEIKITCTDEKIRRKIAALGFQFVPLPDYYKDFYGNVDGMYYVFKVSSVEEKANTLSDIRNLQIPFAGGKEWNPQEVFEYLRERGYLFGSYLAISWSSSDKFVVTEK